MYGRLPTFDRDGHAGQGSANRLARPYPLIRSGIDQNRVAVLSFYTVNEVEEYRRQAAEYDALARNARNEAQREQILRIADTWRKLAVDRERRLRSQQHIKKR